MRLREFRDRQGLSATDMARKLGVSHTTIMRWERGVMAPAGAMLRRIAEVTDNAVTPNDMLMPDEQSEDAA